MGYIHDTSMRFVIPPSLAGGYGGSWGHMLEGPAEDPPLSWQWYYVRTAGAGAFYLSIPIAVPHQNANENRGSRISSVDVYYQVATLALTTLTPAFNLQTWELSGGSFALPETPAFTADSSHEDNAQRVTVGTHLMNLALNSPLWLQDDESLQLVLYGDAGATPIFRFWGAQVHYTLRI